MTGRTSVSVERLRPAGMRAKPLRMPRVFADPDAALARICEGAPYQTMPAFQGFKTSADVGAFPWFLGDLRDDLFLHNPNFIAAAREAFAAEIVQPTSCTLNLNGPMRTRPPHIDLPVFRGFAVPERPVWLLMNMSYSGLFHAWLVPVASALAWFYRGEGGALEYWPEGLDAASAREEPPLWNVGLMGDNEVMWHRVAPIGPLAAQEKLDGHLRPSDLIHSVGDGAWEIRDGARIVAHLASNETRISMLWKAYVFKDEEQLASFKNPAMALDLDQVISIYLADLKRRGIATTRPADPLGDAAWRSLLQDVYNPAVAQKSPYV